MKLIVNEHSCRGLYRFGVSFRFFSYRFIVSDRPCSSFRSVLCHRRGLFQFRGGNVHRLLIAVDTPDLGGEESVEKLRRETVTRDGDRFINNLI
jgi:hypothetical protein